MRLPAFVLTSALLAVLLGCTQTMTRPADEASTPTPTPTPAFSGKPVIYQVFTRLYGNRKTANKPWGSVAENGVGKFADFNDAALASIRAFGTTHLWFTGVPRHASIGDYSPYGIPADDPDVVKGRAGSPYAITDYYDVDPDLATDPARRIDEFKALVQRTHAHGLKVVIDIVPNHVARGYRSIAKPAGAVDFGANDDTTVEYARDNDFYYIPGQPFRVPEWPVDYRPLGGEKHPLADGKFAENPAKWTGNGSRAAQPKFDDWYETVKINFGVRPDGSYDFDRLPADYAYRDIAEHAAFWSAREVPASWKKFKDIASYWLAMGVDGFRYDMAEMVPVEFWSYLNSSIKTINPDAFLIAEVYNPAEYRNYIRLGRMDALYDKVDFYDELKRVMQGKSGTAKLAEIQQRYTDIDSHLLRFLENHDEQRIASPDFAGEAAIGKPAMLVSATIGQGPALWYFAQELGEPGNGDAGFGKATRSSIFDYWGVPTQQRWMNDGRFDGGASTPEERELRAFNASLASFVSSAPALRGAYADLHQHNLTTPGYNEQLHAFARWNPQQRLIVVANFSRSASASFDLSIPLDISANWHLDAGQHTLVDRLGSGVTVPLNVMPDGAMAPLTLPPRAAYLFEVQ
ncbi:MAG: alpha-amylase [Rhodanobacteraceae bacterium]|nr:alpha-amylase [Rhodanobacteraceae bacterium]